MMNVIISVVAALAADCQHVQNATDYPGNDLPRGTRSNVATAAACCALCAAQPGCNAWSLWVSGEQCYLKSSGKGSEPSAGHVSGVPRGAAPPPAGNCSAWFNSTNGQMCTGLKYTPGGEGSVAGCSAACCNERQGCSVWVYNTEGQGKDKRCWSGTCDTPLSGKSKGWVGGAVPAPPPAPGPAPGPGPGPGPRPPPGPPSAAAGYDCGMRSYFVERAVQVNVNIDAARARLIVDALAGDPSLPAGCVVKAPSLSPTKKGRAASVATEDVATGVVVFADANNGSDSAGDGTIAKPYKSAERALEAVRASRNGSSSGGGGGGGGGGSTATINLRAGVYFLASPLALTAADSGLTVQTYPGDDATAWLSGSTPLARVVWKRSSAPNAPRGANVWAADLSNVRGLPSDGVRSLRVEGGDRAILARYPNCNPATELCYGKGGGENPTTTSASSWHQFSDQHDSTSYTAPNGTSRHFCGKEGGSKGCDVPYEMKMGGAGCDLLTPNISHFCGVSKVVGATVSGAEAPHQPYADPTGALFSAMHGGSWCSFAYEVGASAQNPAAYTWDASTKAGTFSFSGGGQ